MCFDRPWCFYLNEITAPTESFVKNCSFWWSPHFSLFEPPNNNHLKKYIQFHRPLIIPPPQPLETSPGETWTQSFVTNFLSFNSRQYESNHHKQDLLLTTSKISHYLLQLYILKVIKFRSAITSSTHPLSTHTHSLATHTLISHSQSIFSIL